jgi:hypothetical protein
MTTCFRSSMQTEPPSVAVSDSVVQPSTQHDEHEEYAHRHIATTDDKEQKDIDVE